VDDLKLELSYRGQSESNWRLINGFAGFALTVDYARRCGLDVPSSLPSDLLLEGVRFATNDSDASLYFGLAGLGWVGDVIGVWTELGTDLADEFDTQLTATLRRPFPPHAHSLFRGLAGLGVYALQRGPRTGPENAAMIVQRLKDGAITDSDGTTWSTDSRVTPGPGGCSTWYSMGLPHGLLAVICFLSLAAQARIAGADELLLSSARWLHAQRASDRPGQCFPAAIDGRLRTTTGRLAWCYGDLPVALTLLQAGAAASEQSWTDTAREVATLAASVPSFDPAECSLCHGDSGIGFSFAFLYNALGSPELLEAARHWLNRTVRRRSSEAPYQGYQALFENPWDASLPPRRSSSGQFLRGAGGIAMALLAGAETVTPDWAGALMLPWNAFSARGARNG
jgi:hypothetical protein